jgi:hypothetical protein
MSQSLTRPEALATGVHLAEDSVIQAGRGVAVGLSDRLGVEGEGKPRVGVPEPGLRRLDVHACSDELSCVGPPEGEGHNTLGRLMTAA